ncbi:hypothetical protein HanRHA438_Chr07g0315211 [Helianthus annuus]|nr:hypothetical protein HanIR_Chr07g0330431 [Helianthus annuus]KAJ0908866.1 hypothetical protein HanRHA438_Chr07g0315211 [Helianthus annuus]
MERCGSLLDVLGGTGKLRMKRGKEWVLYVGGGVGFGVVGSNLTPTPLFPSCKCLFDFILFCFYFSNFDII